MRCSIAAMSDRDPKGFSTRAIRAASRTPAVHQRPTTVPIYQTATFTSTDAEELADVVSDARAGYSYTRLSNPTSRALGDAFAEIAGAEAGTSLSSGMGAVHAALGSQLSGGRPDRRPAGGLRLDPQAPGRHLHAVRRPGRPRRHDRQHRRGRGRRGRTDEGRLRRDHRQPDDRGDRPRDGRAARARARSDLPGRQHLRLAVRLPADRARGRPRHRIGDQVPRWPQRRHRRRRRRPRRPGPSGRGVPERHGRHDRAVRCVPRPARAADARRAHGAPRQQRRGTRRRGSSVRTAWSASSIRVSPAIRSTTSPSASSATAWPAACSPSRSRVVARPVRRSSTRWPSPS